MGQTNTAVDRTGLQFPVALLSDDNGTGTAITFAATFFGSGAMQVFAQDFEQGPARRHVVQSDGFAVFYKSNGLGFHVLGSPAMRVNR